jgi:nucleotide-binding universal stress UspA family protein
MALPGALLPFDKILCPIDFSEPAYTALGAARELSVYFSSQLTLLHVLHPVPEAAVDDRSPKAEEQGLDYRQDLEREVRASLSEVADEQGLLRDRLSLVVLHGDPADAVVRFSSEHKHDLIVIATHGRTGWRRSVFGSVAERVIRLAPCPVLTIRDPTAW